MQLSAQPLGGAVTIQDLGSIGELVAAIATVVTLLYLAIQIRNSARVARAQSQRELLATYSMSHPLLADAELIGVVRRGLVSFHTLTKDEQAQFHHWLHPLFNQIEAMFRMHRQGLFEEESYIGGRSVAVSIIATHGGAEWWSFAQTQFAADFAEAINAALKADADRIVPWSTALPFYSAD